MTRKFTLCLTSLLLLVECSKPRPSVRTAPSPPPNSLRLVAGVLAGHGNVDGVGENARFHQPCDVASDGRGRIFVADSDGNTIRQLELASGRVTTLAGSPSDAGYAEGVGASARFNAPCGVASDGARFLYVSDSGNHVIRRIDVPTGAVTTLAGSPHAAGTDDGVGDAARFIEPLGLDLDHGRDLYVVDSASGTIRKLDLATREVTTVAGVPQQSGSADGPVHGAKFFTPKDVVSDHAGNLYVTDNGNALVRKIALRAGVVETLAGQRDRNGLRNVADGRGDAGHFGSPYSLLYDGHGSLYVTDIALRKIDTRTAEVTTVSGTLTPPDPADGARNRAHFDAVRGLALAGGALYLSELWQGRIRRVDVGSGDVVTVAGPSPVSAAGERAAFAYPSGLARGGAGKLFVSDGNLNSIESVDLASGRVQTIAGKHREPGRVDGTRGEARFYAPLDLVADGLGNLYVADSGNGSVRKVETSTGRVTTLELRWRSASGAPGEPASFQNPRGIARDQSGHLYLADSSASAIRTIELQSLTVSTLAGRGVQGSVDDAGALAEFSFPVGLACDAENLFVADMFNHTIRRVSLSDARVTTLAGKAGQRGSTDGQGAAARFNDPEGLALAPNGDLFVADSGNHSVRRLVVATGVVTTVVGSPKRAGVQVGVLPESLSKPRRIVFLEDGQLALTDELAVLRKR